MASVPSSASSVAPTVTATSYKARSLTGVVSARAPGKRKDPRPTHSPCPRPRRGVAMNRSSCPRGSTAKARVASWSLRRLASAPRRLRRERSRLTTTGGITRPRTALVLATIKECKYYECYSQFYSEERARGTVWIRFNCFTVGRKIRRLASYNTHYHCPLASRTASRPQVLVPQGLRPGRSGETATVLAAAMALRTLNMGSVNLRIVTPRIPEASEWVGSVCSWAAFLIHSPTSITLDLS